MSVLVPAHPTSSQEAMYVLSSVLNLKMEVTDPSKTVVTTYKTT
jgi:hypothetical protein